MRVIQVEFMEIEPINEVSHLFPASEAATTGKKAQFLPSHQQTNPPTADVELEFATCEGERLGGELAAFHLRLQGTSEHMQQQERADVLKRTRPRQRM